MRKISVFLCSMLLSAAVAAACGSAGQQFWPAYDPNNPPINPGNTCSPGACDATTDWWSVAVYKSTANTYKYYHWRYSSGACTYYYIGTYTQSSNSVQMYNGNIYTGSGWYDVMWGQFNAGSGAPPNYQWSAANNAAACAGAYAPGDSTHVIYEKLWRVRG